MAHVTSDNQRPIGVFDSGVGGLTVLSALCEALPDESFVYLGDTARVPYGNKSPETIRRYARECAEFLLRHGVKLIVVACNSVSSVALDVVESLVDLPVVGMIAPAVSAALAASPHRRIGIIATRATVNSGAYERALHDAAPNEEVWIKSVPCPLFVPLAEEGFAGHPAAKLIAEEYLSVFRNEACDSLILACTHFPLIQAAIHEVLPTVTLINSGVVAAAQVAALVQSDGMANESGRGGLQCFMSDRSPGFAQLVERFLGQEGVQTQVVDLSVP